MALIMLLVCDSGRADIISLINTLLGMEINIHTQKPTLGNVTGGLSGPCVKPVALRMVYQVAKAVSVPLIGMGGISCAEDAIEFLLAGASAVAVGTANFNDPAVTMKICDGINDYLAQRHLESVQDIIGAAL